MRNSLCLLSPNYADLKITLMLQTVYSQAAFAQFMHSEASKSFSIDLTNASLVECLTAKINFKAR